MIAPAQTSTFDHPAIADAGAATSPRPDAPDAIVGATLKQFGSLDILFNNAGVANSNLAAETDDETWDRVNGINLRAVFRIARAAIPHLVKSSAGRVINTASVMAQGTDYGLVCLLRLQGGGARALPARWRSNLASSASPPTPSCPAPSTPA